MREEYKPNMIVVDRAVVLWKDMLAAPKYDNGDDSPTGGLAFVMMAMMPKNNIPEVLDAFGKALREKLVTPQHYESHGSKWSSYVMSLDVDYWPCKELSEAAQSAGLEMQFPIKTHMHLYDDRLSVSCGYGAETKYHYPLSDGRWLVTTLSGSDISKILALAESGVLNLELKFGIGVGR